MYLKNLYFSIDFHHLILLLTRDMTIVLPSHFV